MIGAMAAQAELLDADGDSSTTPRSARLAQLVLVRSPLTPLERLEAALGPELARFLVTALVGGQGRVGLSSPYTRT
jgi:hypothetical protein